MHTDGPLQMMTGIQLSSAHIWRAGGVTCGADRKNSSKTAERMTHVAPSRAIRRTKDITLGRWMQQQNKHHGRNMPPPPDSFLGPIRARQVGFDVLSVKERRMV